MKKAKPILIGLGAVALLVLVWQVFGSRPVEGGVTNADLSGEIPQPRPGGPDFGPLDDKYIIGKNPGDPGTPGGPGAGGPVAAGKGK